MSRGKENSVKTLVSRGAGISFKSAEHSGNITWGSCDDDTMTFQILRHFILTFYISIFDTSDIEAFDTYGFTPLHRMASNNLRFESIIALSRSSLIHRPIHTRFYYQYIVSSRSSFIPSNNPYKIDKTFSFLSQGAKALLECGADPLNVGKIGQSPLQVAHSSNAKDVLKVLQVSDDHFVQIQIHWSKTNICFHNCTFSTGLGKRAKRSWNCENRGRRSRI